MGSSTLPDFADRASYVFESDETKELKELIVLIRQKYRQDAVAWLECDVELI